jgi:hypothetical protein
LGRVYQAFPPGSRFASNPIKMDKTNNPIIEFLKAIQQRPLMYISRMDTELLECLIHGFSIGCFASSGDAGLIAKHAKLRIDVLKERGWNSEAYSPSKEMKQLGMSDVDIIDELLKIEIEVWQRIK